MIILKYLLFFILGLVSGIFLIYRLTARDFNDLEKMLDNVIKMSKK